MHFRCRTSAETAAYLGRSYEVDVLAKAFATAVAVTTTGSILSLAGMLIFLLAAGSRVATIEGVRMFLAPWT